MPRNDQGGRIVDFRAILAYASRFPEMRMLRQAPVDVSRLAGSDAPVSRPLDDFLGLATGMRFGQDWIIEAVALHGEEVDFECTGPGPATATFVVGGEGRGPAGPFDRPGLRIGYQDRVSSFEQASLAGQDFADLAARTIEVPPTGWPDAIEKALADNDESGLTPDQRKMFEIRPDGKIYVRLTNDCQERCPFCFYYDTPQEIGASALPESSISEVLRRFDPATTTQIILTGGEPTLVPGFENHLDLLLDRGFREIVVQTNGIVTARRGFLDRYAVFNNRISFGFSLHAATAATSNAMTGVTSSGNFTAKIESIRKAVKLGYMTKITCVLTTLNLPELNDIVDFCVSTGSGGKVPDNVLLQLSMPVVRGRMAKNRNLVPRLGDVRRAVENAMDRASGAGLLTSFSSLSSIPPCSLPRHLEHLESMWYREGPTEWWENERSFGPQCGGCAMKGWCSGVSPLYITWFGDGELVPFDPAATEIVMPTDERRPECP